MRNLINQQEDGHQAMFDKINDKLQDEEFFQQVLQTAENNLVVETSNVTDKANVTTNSSSLAIANVTAK